MDSTTEALVSGIYRISNRHTGRVYIGKSSNVHGRWLAHRAALERGLHINADLQGNWEAYGADAFEFVILEVANGHRALCKAETRHLSMATNPYNIVRPRARKVASTVYPKDTPPIMPAQFLELMYHDIEPPNAMYVLYALCKGAESVLAASWGAVLSNALEANPDLLDDFAIFQDWGYRGLYNGETAHDIAARKELKRGQRILDWMGGEELAANLVRATQAEAKLRRESITGKAEANLTHFEVGRKVRRFIVEDLGGTPPEQLPTPTASIQELQRREQRRLEAEHQPSLFAADTTDASDSDE